MPSGTAIIVALHDDDHHQCECPWVGEEHERLVTDGEQQTEAQDQLEDDDAKGVVQLSGAVPCLSRCCCSKLSCLTLQLFFSVVVPKSCGTVHSLGNPSPSGTRSPTESADHPEMRFVLPVGQITAAWADPHCAANGCSSSLFMSLNAGHSHVVAHEQPAAKSAPEAGATNEAGSPLHLPPTSASSLVHPVSRGMSIGLTSQACRMATPRGTSGRGMHFQAVPASTKQNVTISIFISAERTSQPSSDCCPHCADAASSSVCS